MREKENCGTVKATHISQNNLVLNILADYQHRHRSTIQVPEIGTCDILCTFSTSPALKKFSLRIELYANLEA